MAFSFITYIIQALQDTWKSYTNPEDTEEDDEYETVYVTQIRYRGPLRETKMFFVSEMPDFFTDAELNEGYHTKQEYVQANDKYGYIYKYQKFENADTVEKLQSYATDWIKNNYHGGLTSFDITALDMHLSGEDPDLDPYMVGDKIDVYYYDPDSGGEEHKVLSCISAEYDLHNPEKTKYKIGIPDTTLNKVYGETVKSGGGGGGGNNTEDENDEEDDKEAETTEDFITRIKSWMDENGWSFMSKWLPGGEDGTETSDPNLETPKKRDFTNPFNMNMMADYMKAQAGSWAEGLITKLQSSHITSSYDVTTKDLTASNKTKTKDLSVEEDATTKNLTASEKVQGENGEFTTIKIGGHTVSFGTGKITIDGTTYDLK